VRSDRLRADHQPALLVAYMTEQLAPAEAAPGARNRHRLRLIRAAILSRLCRHVLTIERYRTLADTARRRLEKLGYDNIGVMFGDGLISRPAPGISTASS